MNIVKKFKSVVYCNLLYHEGFILKVNNIEFRVCKNCKKSFKEDAPTNILDLIQDANNGDDKYQLLEDKENKVFNWYLDKTNGMVDNPKKLKPEDFQLIKICHPELEEYSKLWKI